MDASWFWGALLGLSLAAPPGPMNALIADASARSGWGTGMRIGAAAPLADTLYLVLFAAGLAPWLEGQRMLLRALAFLGAAVMAFFAFQAFTAPPGQPLRAGFVKAFLLALTNPYQLAWWLTAGVVFVQDQGMLWSAGFLAGIYGWVVGFSGLVAGGARRWPWFAPAVRIVSGVGLAAFALVVLLYAFGVELL